jgi:hypothetical protein
MTKEELLDQIAELARQYEESTYHEEVIGVEVLFENGTSKNPKEPYFLWEVWQYDGEEMDLDERIISVNHVFRKE